MYLFRRRRYRKVMRKGCPAIAYVVIPMISIDRLLVSPIIGRRPVWPIACPWETILYYSICIEKHDRVLLLYIIWIVHVGVFFVKPNVSTWGWPSCRKGCVHWTWFGPSKDHNILQCCISATANRLNKTTYCYNNFVAQS